MTRFTDVICRWFGWCPNTRALRTAPVVLTAPSPTADASVPGGGASRPGRLNRGVSLALGSLRILFGNWQLLGFTVLTGLVLVFSLAAMFSIQYLSGVHPLSSFDLASGSRPILIVPGSPVWIALTFVSMFVTVFLSTIILAGLISCVSLLFSGNAANLRKGFAAASQTLPSLACWALMYAILTTLQSVVVNLCTEDNALTIIAALIVLPVGIMTLFVVPVIVLEGKGIAGAVKESFFLLRKTWGETLAGFFVFIVLYAAIAFVSLMPAAAAGFPSGNQHLIGLTMALYLFVLIGVIMLYSTVIGIFLTGLYSSARTGRVPALFERKLDTVVFP